MNAAARLDRENRTFVLVTALRALNTGGVLVVRTAATRDLCVVGRPKIRASLLLACYYVFVRLMPNSVI